MKIKLDHINLTVQNLSESIAWYEKIFGFKLVESGVGSRNQNWAIVASDDSMIVMGEYPGRSKAERDFEESSHKIYHFGIRVSDLPAWEKIVEDYSLKLYYGGVVEYPFSRSWYIQDPNGHEIEVSYTSSGQLRFP